MLVPGIALSVRQPWAWAIIFAGKNIENRSRFAITKGSMGHVRRVAVHAAKGMTRDEYEDAREFMLDRCGVTCPAPAELDRGGIIGSVKIVGLTRGPAMSPWFTGPCGLILEAPEACSFVPAIGALGIFDWKPADDGIVPPPAQWMLKWGSSPTLPIGAASSEDNQGSLF